MERFPNFPQTIDPVESETILEQFLELNNNVEKINQGYNEIVPQVDTNTTDIAQLKTQVSESGTRVSVNGVLQAEWSPDDITEDVEQLRLAQSSDSLAIVGLQSDNITNKSDISTLKSDVSDLQGDVSSLNQTMQRTLKVPLSYPPEIELVGVDDNGSQIMVQIDSILSATSENPVKNSTLYNYLKYSHGTKSFNSTYVSQGICNWWRDGQQIYVYIADLKFTSTTPNENQSIITSNLPKPLTSNVTYSLTPNGSGGCPRININQNGGIVNWYSSAWATSLSYYGFIAYIAKDGE